MTNNRRNKKKKRTNQISAVEQYEKNKRLIEAGVTFRSHKSSPIHQTHNDGKRKYQ